MGNYNLKDILSDEIFLVSYSYNYAEPRFYTKMNALDKQLKLDYDVTLDFAARASSAIPLYFDPVFKSTLRGKQRQLEILIDGGILATNPSLLATIYAKNELQKESVRMVSIGFRPKREPDSVNLQEMNAYEWIKRMDQILIDSSVTTDHYFSKRILSGEKDEYFRFETTSQVSMYDASSIGQLKIEGDDFLFKNTAAIEKVIADILQEKYGSNA